MKGLENYVPGNEISKNNFIQNYKQIYQTTGDNSHALEHGKSIIFLIGVTLTIKYFTQQ